MDACSPTDIQRGYAWLGHAGAYTEISVLHPQYRANDRDWNRAHHAWPIITYITSLAGLEAVVRQYAGERLVCYGLNPRPHILTKPDGRVRSATEADIRVSQNLVLDIDLQGQITRERIQRLKAFLKGADEYFTTLGLKPPVHAATGRGAHLLFAYPPIWVSTCPDLRERLRTFRHQFASAHHSELGRLEAHLDNTQDLRRMIRVYGTSKPSVGYNSRFFGRARDEDAALPEHLLTLPTSTPANAAACPPLTLSGALPAWFAALLDRDKRAQQLWHSQGKPTGSDQTSSGYDYSLACYLIRRGHTDPHELGTILTLRPDVKRHQKRPEYVARTVHNALARTKPEAPA